MLIISYGITKSGSTLTFELIKGMLNSIGQQQERLPDGVVMPSHRINFIGGVNKELIANLLAAIPDTRMIAVKTHSSIHQPTFLWLEELQAQRKVQVVASYRDPRDICLSLLDAGRSARMRGTEPFSEFTDIASTLPSLEHQLQTFQRWASIKGALRLNYETVAFSPDKTIDALERALGIKCDREYAKRYAYNKAFTQKNKGVARRHVNELDASQRQDLQKAFGPFIEGVCTRNDDGWFAAFREDFLTNPPPKRAPAQAGEKGFDSKG